jgi:hypothetical protein
MGERELRSVKQRKEKDISPYEARRARGTRRVVVLEDCKTRLTRVQREDNRATTDYMYFTWHMSKSEWTGRATV